MKSSALAAGANGMPRTIGFTFKSATSKSAVYNIQQLESALVPIPTHLARLGVFLQARDELWSMDDGKFLDLPPENSRKSK